MLVRVDAFGNQPSLVWAAAMSLANTTTTNNQAEYFGLVIGLRFVAAKRLRPLTVISDSALIVTQLRNRRAPKNDALRALYAQARVLADAANVTTWCHHVRAHNKMADCAANLAMDNRRSVQTRHPAERSYWAALLEHLRSDVDHWHATASPVTE